MIARFQGSHAGCISPAAKGNPSPSVRLCVSLSSFFMARVSFRLVYASSGADSLSSFVSRVVNISSCSLLSPASSSVDIGSRSLTEFISNWPKADYLVLLRRFRRTFKREVGLISLTQTTAPRRCTAADLSSVAARAAARRGFAPNGWKIASSAPNSAPHPHTEDY